MSPRAADFWAQADQQRREISRLCQLTWDTGCTDHGGKAHRCVRYDLHRDDHECECLDRVPRDAPPRLRW